MVQDYNPIKTSPRNQERDLYGCIFLFLWFALRAVAFLKHVMTGC